MGMKNATVAGVLLLSFLSALTGCLGSAPKAPAYWLFGSAPLSARAPAVAPPSFGTVRVAQLNVLAPYDGMRLAVLRDGGEVAFDACNSFAASPAALLRGLTWETVAASGRFARAVQATSQASAPYTLETTVTRLALDCRTEGARRATAEVSVTLLKGREIVSVAKGRGVQPAAMGEFGVAFSLAFTSALLEALGRL